MIVIVKINQERPPPRTGHVTFPFECDFPDIRAIESALQAGNTVYGQQLVYDKVRSGPSVIRERRPITLRDDEVRSMQMPQQRFEERA